MDPVSPEIESGYNALIRIRLLIALYSLYLPLSLSVYLSFFLMFGRIGLMVEPDKNQGCGSGFTEDWIRI